MKLSYFKHTAKALLLAFTMGLASSCTSDLDVTPIDPSVSTEFDQNAVFAKIYASMAITGQQGATGDADISGIDEGTSSFYRLVWNFNELPTDEALCSWTDAGIPEMNFMRWSSGHGQLEALYARLYFGITLCNHFLEKTSGASDAATVKQRAETRFMRALNYQYLLDFFGNVPFVESVTSALPAQIKRADLYAYVEKELLAAEADMYDALQAPYGRADKVAAQLLLSRLYLNAEVYTGTAQWAKAAEYAKKVMDSDYTLSTNYAELFMGNNGENANARKEIILPIRFDGTNSQTWGGALFLIASTHTAGMGSWGTTSGWSGNRGRQALASKFFSTGIVPAGLTNATTAAGDARALFCTYGEYTEGSSTKTFVSTLPINDVATFKEGVSIIKFSNAYSDGSSPKNSNFVDMDVPFLRKAEAYLTYAEALLRNGGSTTDALAAVNTLRSRAGATPFTTLTLDRVLDEKAREFYFEAQRRTDLIRYGYFTTSNYLWDWKGGSQSGSSVSSIYNLLPLPASDLNANGNLVQNTGY